MLYNLLDQPEILHRDATERMKNKENNRAAAMKFGKEYFDGTREQGYGGYHYDGRWQPVAKRIVERYSLTRNNYFLDVGCAKGFLMKDMQKHHVCVRGIDISAYAKKTSIGFTKNYIRRESCKHLSFANGLFHASVAINTIHNLDLDGCKEAIRELMRVTKNKKNIFIQVDAYHDRQKFEDWNLTAKTCLRPAEWEELFKEVGYEGDFFFTILG